MRKLALVALLLCVVGLLAGGVLAWAYHAARSVPKFYEQALAQPAQGQDDRRDAFVARVTALASDLNRPGRWQTLFSVDEINSWLALELKNSYPDLLPQELIDPRVSISAGELTVGCRYRDGKLATVLSLAIEVYVQEPHVVAVRIRRARAGALPVPLGQVLDSISHVARQLQLSLEWRRSEGDPVALITLRAPRDAGQRGVQLEKLELREGELFAAGRVGKVPASSAEEQATPLPTAAHKEETADEEPLVGSAEKDTIQK